ncbi:Tetrapartite efflux system, membrane fusion component FusE-like [Olavius algarvensis Delta 1 endosymbiont]|nr:Tetrapartite efflux system, membrane fusion component FusE-like [Olavius algarvensis Delta 1 endosymbiont]
MKAKLKFLITGMIVLIAAIVVALKYWDYIANPWTRDGQVRAQVIQITPRVSGPIIKLPIKDNQFVKAGDLLFEIDPRTFEANLEHARADLDNTRDEIEALAKQVEAARADVEAAEATIKQSQAAIKGYSGRVVETKKEYDRQRKLDKQGATSKRMVEQARANWVSYVNQKANAEAELLQMQASLSEAKANLAKAKADLGAPGERNAKVRLAKAEVRSAELNLEFTQKRAPVDGYVTNLNLRLGSQAVENQPILALVDVNSYWVVGFFKENYIEGIRDGDRAILTLMSYRDKPLEGRVDSLGWGISQDDGSTGFNMLPTISATFEWIRLAQRVPVRIHIDLDKLPAGVKLRVGTTTSVLVMTGTSGSESKRAAVAAPRALQ